MARAYPFWTFIRLSIGGSDANTILSGDEDRVIRLWREKRREIPPEDLSGKLPVVLGSWTEDFNRQWYEKLSGNRVTDAGKVLTCSKYRWRTCTLDGLVQGSGAVFEAKHTNSFVSPHDVLERYMPQLQHNMAVAKADRAILSVIFGNSKYEMFEVAADWLYQIDLLQAENDFWQSVLSGEPPVTVGPPTAPRPVATREIRFDGNNAWASAAADSRMFMQRRSTPWRVRALRSSSRMMCAAPLATASRRSAASPARLPSGVLNERAPGLPGDQRHIARVVRPRHRQAPS